MNLNFNCSKFIYDIKTEKFYISDPSKDGDTWWEEIIMTMRYLNMNKIHQNSRFCFMKYGNHQWHNFDLREQVKPTQTNPFIAKETNSRKSSVLELINTILWWSYRTATDLDYWYPAMANQVITS